MRRMRSGRGAMTITRSLRYAASSTSGVTNTVVTRSACVYQHRVHGTGAAILVILSGQGCVMGASTIVAPADSFADDQRPKGPLTDAKPWRDPMATLCLRAEVPESLGKPRGM
jgi:hypothetical protein